MEDIIDFDDNSALALTPEGKMLTCMLYVAVEDAIYNVSRLGRKKTAIKNHRIQSDNRIEAIHWLFDDNDVYDLCCSVAGIHKDQIRTFIREKLGDVTVDAILYNFVNYDPKKTW